MNSNNRLRSWHKLIFIRLLSLCVITLVFISLASPCRADFATDYQGFLKTYDAYRSAHSRYLTTRNQYLQFGTLNSQTEALNAVKDFLIMRDSILLSYISLLRLKTTDDTLNTLLDQEYEFLQNHQDKIPAISTLDDAVRISQEAEKRHLPFQLLSRKIVATLLINKVNDLRLRYTLLETNTRDIVKSLNSQNKSVDVLERWLLEAKSKELLSTQKLNEATSLSNNMRATSLDQLTKDYNQVQFTVFEANQYIREALGLLTELSETIKYGHY